VDAKTSKANSIKESGAAKVQELIHKSEEIRKEVHFNRFLSQPMCVCFSYENELAV
jgi:hypothetical protein